MRVSIKDMYEIKNSLAVFLFFKPTALLKESLDTLVKAHQTLTNGDNNQFKYQGKYYFGFNGTKTKDFRGALVLVESLQPKMELYLKTYNDLDYEKEVILGYIQNLINSVDTADELYLLLPDPLRKGLESIYEVPEGAHIPSRPLTECVILQPSHHSAVDMLKTRLMMNLLT